jgi:hypothetical protein
MVSIIRRRALLTAFFFLSLFSSCTYHDLNDPVDCEVSKPSLEIIEVIPATSCSSADGSIRVAANGGEPPYTFFLNDVQQTSASDTLKNLAPGIYTVRVTDKNGCSETESNIVVMALDFSFTAHLEEDTDCLADNGSITVFIIDGDPPYTYKLEDGEFGESPTFTSLRHGTHTIFVKDANDCTISLNLTIQRGLTGTSWSQQIQPLIKNHCATSGCHTDTNKERINIQDYAKAKLYASQIKSLTQDGTMPMEGPRLTQAQIDLIACWVDDGALEN